MAAAPVYNCAEYTPFLESICAADEQGRVQQLMLVEESVIPVSPLALNSAFFLSQETAAKAIVFRDVSGTYDGGAPTKGPGFGSEQERTTGKVHTLAVKIPKLLGNEAAAQSLEKRAGLYRVIWLTGTRLWVAPKGAKVNITALFPVGENTTDLVTPMLTVVFSKNELVRTYAGFDVTGFLSGVATVGAGGTLPLPPQS